jgi:DNA-binding PadR family transcriptional regulator
MVLQFVHDYQKLCGGRTPSTRLIAKGVTEQGYSISHQSVFNALERLEKLGYVEREDFEAKTKVRAITILTDGEIALRMHRPPAPVPGSTLLDEPGALGD